MQHMAARSFDRTKHIVQSTLQSIGGPTALGISLAIAANDWASAVSHSIDPLTYNSAEDFRQAYLAVCLLKKFSAEVPGINGDERKRVTLTKYLSVEADLREVDRKLTTMLLTGYDPTTCTIIAMARSKIVTWLGPLNLDEIADGAHFGPGASSSVRGRDVSVYEKMSRPSVEATKALTPLAVLLLSRSRWGDSVSKIVTKEYVEVITVPKTALADRTIGIEPDMNIVFQLGIGEALRRRLKRVGCDLDQGWKRNAELARKGSIDASLFTLDLSSASDRISYKLVRELFPADWFELLTMARTPFAKVENALYPLRKFSSMGNGFTFELESMIFLALTLACVQFSELPADDVAVFGDDIIGPTAAWDLVTRVFTDLGFVVNFTKSFVRGYFRESCGAHFFHGRDCKPVYVKRPIENETEFFKMANALRRLASRWFGVDIRHTRLLAAYKCTVSHIQPRRRFKIPDGYGDGGLCCSFDEVVPHLGNGIRRLSRGFEGFKVRALVPIASVVTRSDPLLLNGVYFGLYRRKDDSRQRYPNVHAFITDRVIVRDSLAISEEGCLIYAPREDTKRMRVAWMIVPEWFDPA